MYYKVRPVTNITRARRGLLRCLWCKCWYVVTCFVAARRGKCRSATIFQYTHVNWWCFVHYSRVAKIDAGGINLESLVTTPCRSANIFGSCLFHTVLITLFRWEVQSSTPNIKGFCPYKLKENHSMCDLCVPQCDGPTARWLERELKSIIKTKAALVTAIEKEGEHVRCFRCYTMTKEAPALRGYRSR